MKNSTLILTLSLIIFLFSCKEEDPLTNEPGTYSSKDSFKVEQAVGASEMAISNISHLIQLAIDQEQVFHNNGIIYSINKKEKENPNQTDIYPMILTLDFGLDTIQGYDNRYRSGKIVARISSYWKDSLSKIEADVQNYYMATHTPNYINGQNQVFITGCNSNMKLYITNNGLTNSFDNPNYPTQYIIADSAKISTPLGSITFSTQRNTYYTNGFDTPTYEDDKTINTLLSGGTASDKNNNNWQWDLENLESTDEGLSYFAYNRNCFWLISGNIKLNYKDIKAERAQTNIIEFGKSDQSSCDNISSYLTNGLNIVFNLP